MHIKIILIYCDDFLSVFGLNDDKQCRMTSAEILTVAIISALFFSGNFSRTRFILKHDGYISNMISESHSSAFVKLRKNSMMGLRFIGLRHMMPNPSSLSSRQHPQQI